MILARFRSRTLRELIGAMLVALALLSGIVQSRAATEAASRSGFAGEFALCLRAGDPTAPADPADHDCDPCRIPAHPVALMAPAVLLIALDVQLASPLQSHNDQPRPSILVFHPGSRGPPASA